MLVDRGGRICTLVDSGTIGVRSFILFLIFAAPLGGEKLLLTTNHLHDNERKEAHQASRQPGQHAERQQGNVRREPTVLPGAW